MARVDTAAITNIDFARALDKLDAADDEVRSLEEWRQQFQLLIDRELLWRQARVLGLDRAAEVVEQVYAWERARLTDMLLQAEMGSQLEWDESELTEYFAARRAGREMRLVRFHLGDRQQAVELLARARAGESLEALAAELGLRPGETDWLNPLAVRDSRLRALFLLEVGTVELIEASGQYVLVAVAEERRVELAERRDLASKALDRKKQAQADLAYLEYLTGKYEVALDTTALQRLAQAPAYDQVDPNLRLVRSKLGNWTLADYRRALERLPAQARAEQGIAGALGLHVTRSYIVDQLLEREAREKGLYERWDLQRRQLHKQQAIEALWQRQALGRMPVTDAEAAAYYEAHKGRYAGRQSGVEPAALRAQVVQDLREEKAAPLFEEYLAELRRRDEALVTVEEENFRAFVAQRRRAESPSQAQ